MARGDVAISVPASWHRSADPGCGVLVDARPARVPASGVRPSLRLSCEPVTGLPERWWDSRRAELAESTVGFVLEEDDGYELNGHDVSYRRYAHLRRGTDLVCEEWSWLVGGLGVVLTCSVARADYPDLCDVFEAIAHTVDPDPGTG